MPGDSVTIIGGTGDLGTGLARRFAQAGVPVVIGSRDEGRARQAAEAIEHGEATGMANAEACGASDVVFLCVPFAAQASNLTVLSEHVREGQLVVDATVPLAVAVGGKATQVLSPWHGSCAQTAQAALKATVVSALHTVSAPALQDLSATLDEDVLVCGRRRDDKRRVARVIERIDGLRCVDAGPLEMSRVVETQTALLIGINGRYRTHAGIKLTGLPDGDLFPPLRR
jgi:NADPH-dependent F420 reductase